MKHILENNRICAIMRGVPLGKTLDYADAVYRGGVRMFEVAMNSGDAARQIELMRKHFGDNAYVGAGTVISAKRCEAAREAGAQFFLTPSATTGTMEFCRRYSSSRRAYPNGCGRVPGVRIYHHEAVPGRGYASFLYQKPERTL